MARPIGTGFKPTDDERALVRSLSAAGVVHERISACIRHGIDDKTLRKHFRQELDQARETVTAVAMGKLVGLINAGNLGAICFWFKCREHWRETAGVELTGPGGGALIPTKVEVVLVPAAKQIVEATAEPVETGNGHR